VTRRKGCKNRRGAFDVAPVLALEEKLALVLKIRRFAVLFRGGYAFIVGLDALY
jgi:hypothetical protein